MIIHRTDMKIEHKERMRGGEGVVTCVHFADPAGMKNSRLVAEMTLPPGASIGEHAHVSETEYYLILSGTGKVIDDGEERSVASGDVVITENGAKHSIINTGKDPLVFHAVIVTY